ncbi:MAG TPA: alpha/beta fold hydrolase [Candidatus Angelobacter sp.]
MERIFESITVSAVEHVQCNGLVFPMLKWGSSSGRPILLLHGFPQEPGTWAPIAEKLAREGFQVFAPLQRGYCIGTQPQQEDGYTFGHFIQDAIALADTLRLDKFDVAGFGIGAALAWMLAAYHPTRIRSLAALRYPHPAAFAQAMQSDPEQKNKWFRVQEDLGAGNPAEKAAAMLADNATGLRRFLEVSGLPQPFLDRYVSRLKEPGTLAGALFWNQAISLEEFARVPAIRIPALYVWTEGPAVARAAAEATRMFATDSLTEVSIEGGGHFMLEISPESLIAPLLQHFGAT